MDILSVLKEDYGRFPKNQTYSIYAKDVYFKDPLNEFQGVNRYKQMIGFIKRWFIDVRMDLYEIKQDNEKILTRWMLSWNAPLPWKPRMEISGWSELKVVEGLIVSHIDYWDCSVWDVGKQLWFGKNS
ncbi:MAG TPA: DUF2358 domain-containing protein [Halomicronema sp.]